MSDASPPVALATVATSADVWHRRLGHRHEVVVRAVAKPPQAEISLTDAMTKCDTVSWTKAFNKGTRRPPYAKAILPLERVYIDLIGPISPAA